MRFYYRIDELDTVEASGSIEKINFFLKNISKISNADILTNSQAHQKRCKVLTEKKIEFFYTFSNRKLKALILFYLNHIVFFKKMLQKTELLDAL